MQELQNLRKKFTKAKKLSRKKACQKSKTGKRRKKNYYRLLMKIAAFPSHCTNASAGRHTATGSDHWRTGKRSVKTTDPASPQRPACVQYRIWWCGTWRRCAGNDADGYGFLRSSDYNIFLLPTIFMFLLHRIKLFGLKTGDTVYGSVRPQRRRKIFRFTQSETINGKVLKK